MYWTMLWWKITSRLQSFFSFPQKTKLGDQVVTIRPWSDKSSDELVDYCSRIFAKMFERALEDRKRSLNADTANRVSHDVNRVHRRPDLILGGSDPQ